MAEKFWTGSTALPALLDGWRMSLNRTWEIAFSKSEPELAICPCISCRARFIGRPM